MTNYATRGGHLVDLTNVTATSVKAGKFHRFSTLCGLQQSAFGELVGRFEDYTSLVYLQEMTNALRCSQCIKKNGGKWD